MWGEKVDVAGVKEKPEKREEDRGFRRGCEPRTRGTEGAPYPTLLLPREILHLKGFLTSVN